jgi:hypothetical protein
MTLLIWLGLRDIGIQKIYRNGVLVGSKSVNWLLDEQRNLGFMKENLGMVAKGPRKLGRILN